MAGASGLCYPLGEGRGPKGPGEGSGLRKASRLQAWADLERRLVERLPPGLRRRWERADALAAGLMQRYGVSLLRLAVATVFVWFGALKLAQRSPVADLVAGTVYWLPARSFVRLLGAWEVAVGLGLLTGVALRLTLLLFWLQMAGTFLVLVVRPDISFQKKNPLLLTMTGEFVIKNLVLIAAGLVIGSTVPGRHRGRERAQDGASPS
ncbi:hypothetical protein HRbin24_01756 [bacterium HR24]|nr:hypothetical protein HRbin24_01756 [bacterium HR24]